MQRPKVPQLDSIMAAVNDLRVAEQRAAEAKATLVDKVAELQDVADHASRLDAAVYAYWFAPETNANQLAMVTTGKAHPAAMLRQADAISIGVACDRCRQDMEITSRAQLRDTQRRSLDQGPPMPEGYRVICRPCRDEVYAARSAAHYQRGLVDDARNRILAQLSYANYLDTPEWRKHRDQVVSGTLYEWRELTCQLCRARDALSFTHLALDRMGNSEHVELLCATCWGALDAAGKVAQRPLEANRANRFELDQITARYLAENGFTPIDK